MRRNFIVIIVNIFALSYNKTNSVQIQKYLRTKFISSADRLKGEKNPYDQCEERSVNQI